jgi:hypothetical protein
MASRLRLPKRKVMFCAFQLVKRSYTHLRIIRHLTTPSSHFSRSEVLVAVNSIKLKFTLALITRDEIVHTYWS